MIDLVDSLLPQIQARRLPDLDLGPSAIHPAYDGLSLLNLPASLCRWLGLDPPPHPPLALPALDEMASGASQFVVCLLDALSLSRFLAWQGGPKDALHPDGLLAALTSVVPSTTSAALTSLWTARSPAEHGIVGYELLLREYGMVANMITLGPAMLESQRGLLERSGIRPESLLTVPTLGPWLRQAGVDAHVFLANSIRASGLSRMHYGGCAVHGFGSPADLWQSVRALVEQPPRGQRFVWIYYGAVDALSHLYGPDSDIVRVEYMHFMRAMRELFTDALDRRAARQVLLLVLSDHGQVATPLNPANVLSQRPSLLRRLHLTPTGESRMAYFHLRPGQEAAVQEYLDRTWPDSWVVLRSDHALEAGLFGPGTPAEQTAGRLGDLIAISRDRGYLWWADKDDFLLGRHGSLTADEMLIPLLAVRPG